LLASKVGIIGLGVIILLYFFNRMKNKILAVAICAVILGAFVITIYNSKFLRQRFLVSLEFNYESPYNGSWNSVSQRLAIWSCVVETLEPVFPLGYGTGNGQKALNKTYESNKYIRGFEDEYNAHSEFFHTTLETGAFGLVVLLLMILLPLIHAARIQDTLFAIFIIVFCLYFLVDVVFARRPGIFVFSFFFSILAVRNQILTKVHRDVPVE
jgi:O-antigen ligase